MKQEARRKSRTKKKKLQMTTSRRNHTKTYSESDIFSLQPDAAHLTLITCEPGVQQIEPGDKPPGIISAFLFAGAAPTVGTL